MTQNPSLTQPQEVGHKTVENSERRAMGEVEARLVLTEIVDWERGQVAYNTRGAKHAARMRDEADAYNALYYQSEVDRQISRAAYFQRRVDALDFALSRLDRSAQ